MTVRFFSERRRKGRGARGRFSMAGLRCAELERLFAARYGHELPDDDAGRADVVIMLHHLARCAGDPRQRSTAWCAAHAPWLAAAAELEAMLDDVIEKPRRRRADILAERLGLTAAERRRLRITSIGAIDQSKAERLADRKQRKRLASRERRRAQGARQRDAIPLTISQPWRSAGVSRSTWYRTRRTDNTCPAYSELYADHDLSHAKR